MIKKYSYLIIFLFVIVCFFLMNTLVLFFSDDTDCMYIYGQKISSINDVISILSFDYLNINGRLLCNLTVLSTILIGDNFFNIINTFFFGLVVFLLSKNNNVQSNNINILTLLVTIFGLLSLSTGVDSLYYWASGSSNYLWALAYNILFFYILKRFGDKENSQFMLTLLFVASIILATNNEMFVCPISAALVTYYIFHHKQLNLSKSFIIAGYIIGTLIVVFSPGNFARESLYTNGINYITRIFKILYFLRLSYILIAMLIIYTIRKRQIVKQFIADNALIFLIFAFSFVIPFLAASSMRGVYATEIAALIIILRIIDSCNIRLITRRILSTILLISLILFELFIIHDSHIKWNIYNNTLTKYFNQQGNEVMINDYQSQHRIVEYYTMNLDNMFMPYDKANQHALEKMKINGVKTNKEVADSTTYIKILPENVYKEAIVNNKYFFNKSNRIDGIGFYKSSSLNHSVMKYDKNKLDSINKGYMYALYSLPFAGNLRIKVNYLDYDLGFERAVYDVHTRYGDFILLNMKYKHYPILKLEKIALNSSLPTNKIEVLR